MKQVLLGSGIFLLLLFLILPESKINNTFGKPWQVAIKNGESTIFKITLTKTTLLEATKLLGDKFNVGFILSPPTKETSIEVFYPKITLSKITGTLILSAKSPIFYNDINNPKKTSTLKNGDLFLLLSKVPDNAPISNITFVPNKNLTEKLLIDTFGEPESHITEPNEIEHFLYPNIGVGIALNPTGKDIIQYISPDKFTKIAKPLDKFR